MKKIILGSVLLTTLLSAQWFIGVDYPVSSNMQREQDVSSNSYSASGTYDYEYTPIIFKVGAGDPENLNMNVYFSTAKIEYEHGESSDPLNEIGYDIRKAFAIDSIKGLAPFIQGGVSYGWMKIDENYFNQSNIYSVGLKAGVGISYILADSFQFLLGIDYKYRKWQDIEVAENYNSGTISNTDKGTKVYVGFNLWF